MSVHFRNSPWVKSSIKLAHQQLLRAGLVPLRLIQGKINSMKNARFVAANEGVDVHAAKTSRWRLPRKRTCSLMLGGLLTIFSSLSYLSYTVYENNLIKSHREKVASAKLNIVEALEALDSYLDLVAVRIGNHADDDNKIIEILKTDYLNLIDGSYPTILSLNYYPISNDKRYSRLGSAKNTQSSREFLSHSDPKQQILSIEKKVQGLGTFRAQISLKQILSNNFIITSAPIITAETGFSIDVFGREITFLLDRAQPAVSHFILKNASNIVLLVLAAIGFSLFGASFIYYLLRRHNKVVRLQKIEISRKFEVEQKRCEELQTTISKLNRNFECHERSKEKREELLKLTIHRFSQMASSGLEINGSVSKMISEKFADNKAASQIVDIAQDANLILKRISDGLPIRDDQQYVHIKDVIEGILQSFEYKLSSKGISVNLEDNYKKFFLTDSALLMIVLYSLIRNLIRRYLRQIIIEIIPSSQGGVEISFTDNGHATVSDQEAASKKNILSLCETEMLELTNILGWKISYDLDDGKNKTTLWMPDLSAQQKNVVSITEYRKNA